MDRAQAQAEVLKLATDYRGASVLDYDTARAILGDERFAKMMADDIRNQPRAGQCVYFWNVLDAAMAMEGGKVVYRLESLGHGRLSVGSCASSRQVAFASAE